METEEKVMAGVAIAGIILFTLFCSMSVIPTNTIGVVTSFGRPAGETFQNGINFSAPWTIVHKVDCRNKLATISTECYTKDIQQVKTQIAIQYQFSQDRAVMLYTQYGNVIDDVITSRFVESIKRSIGQFSAEDCVTKRADLRKSIDAIVTDESKEIAAVREVTINDLEFTPVFEKAIEDKQVAGQKVLTAKYENERAVIEAATAVAKAKGEAEAIRVNGEALKSNPSMVLLEAVKKWNGTAPSSLTFCGSALPMSVIAK